MEYTSVTPAHRASKSKVVALIALAVVGTLVASYAVFNVVPAKTELLSINLNDLTNPLSLIDSFKQWKLLNKLSFNVLEAAKRFDASWQASHFLSRTVTVSLANSRICSKSALPQLNSSIACFDSLPIFAMAWKQRCAPAGRGLLKKFEGLAAIWTRTTAVDCLSIRMSRRIKAAAG